MQVRNTETLQTGSANRTVYMGVLMGPRSAAGVCQRRRLDGATVEPKKKAGAEPARSKRGRCVAYVSIKVSTEG